MHSAEPALHLRRAPFAGGRLVLPESSRADARAGLGLLGPNRLAARVAARAYDAWLATAGPRWAGRRADALSPVLADHTTALLAELREAIGPFTGVAAISARQATRPRAALLVLRRGVPLAFVKVNAVASELEREREVLMTLASGGVSVRTPRLKAHGTLDGIAWMALTAMPTAWSRPLVTLPNGWLEGREFAALAPLLGEPPRSGWVPLHGDLTPWNFRFCSGEPWLLDWEDVAWGPTGADEAHFHATATAVCGAPLQPAPAPAIDWCRELVSARQTEGADLALQRNLLMTLDRMSEMSASGPNAGG